MSWFWFKIYRKKTTFGLVCWRCKNKQGMIFKNIETTTTNVVIVRMYCENCEAEVSIWSWKIPHKKEFIGSLDKWLTKRSERLQKMK